jgi:hypothetical protein
MPTETKKSTNLTDSKATQTDVKTELNDSTTTASTTNKTSGEGGKVSTTRAGLA